MKTILVTGGAGYIGSVVTEQLVSRGNRVIILDNLEQGHREAIHPEAEFVEGDIRDADACEQVFHREKIDAVMHMAAESIVPYSMTDPGRFYQINVAAGLSLLDAMLRHDVDRCVFSSSAAVYGQPESIPMEEDHIKEPCNAYGDSKLAFERILKWYGEAYGLKHLSLRYFNAAGATERFGEDHEPETHLIPIVLKAALEGGTPVSVFGDDYPTMDGSPVRDYVHVADIADAHLLALDALNLSGETIFNLGNGVGYSVLEVLAAAREITGSSIPHVVKQRRAGDPALLVASSDRATAELGWKPKFSSLESIIESAWEWIERHPRGYGERQGDLSGRSA